MPWNKDQMHEKISKRKFRSNFFQLNLFCQLWHILPAYTWDRNPNFVLTQLQLWDMIAHISPGKQARKWQIINIKWYNRTDWSTLLSQTAKKTKFVNLCWNSIEANFVVLYYYKSCNFRINASLHCKCCDFGILKNWKSSQIFCITT